jgi:hypothetical protein
MQKLRHSNEPFARCSEGQWLNSVWLPRAPSLELAAAARTCLAPHRPRRRLNGKRYLPPSPLNGERAGVRGEKSPARPLAMYLRSISAAGSARVKNGNEQHRRTAVPPCGTASAPERRWDPNRSPCSKTRGVLERPARGRISNAPRLRTLMQPEAEGCGPCAFLR